VGLRGAGASPSAQAPAATLAARVQLRGRPMGAAGGLRLGGAVNEVVICAVPADGAEFQDGFVAVRLLLAEVAASGLRTLYLHGLLAALYCRSSVL
jgi:hypothetical protein